MSFNAPEFRPPEIRSYLRFLLSGCRDLNSGPSVPQTDALTKLRHTFATIGLSGGVSPHQVTAALGHHDMAVTLGTYAHLLPGAQAAAMNAAGNLIFGPSDTKNVT